MPPMRAALPLLTLSALLLSGCGTPPPPRVEVVRVTCPAALTDVPPEPVPGQWETTADAAADYLRAVTWGRTLADALAVVRERCGG